MAHEEGHNPADDVIYNNNQRQESVGKYITLIIVANI